FPARPSPQRLRGYQATVKVVRPPNRSDPYRLCNAAQYHRSSKTPIPSGLHRPHDPRKYPSYRDTYQDDSDKGHYAAKMPHGCRLQLANEPVEFRLGGVPEDPAHGVSLPARSAHRRRFSRRHQASDPNQWNQPIRSCPSSITRAEPAKRFGPRTNLQAED